MKTSIDLPDDLYRQVKARSALEGRAVRQVATELLAQWVASDPAPERAAGAGESSTKSAADWRYQWAALGARVSEAIAPDATAERSKSKAVKKKRARSTGLVDQLKRDRR